MSQVTHPHRTSLRITRRGRLVVAALTALPILAASVFLATPRAQAGADTGEVEYYTVLSGESLWEIAESISPERDPREVIDILREANSLDSLDVVPGERLIVPAGL